ARAVRGGVRAVRGPGRPFRRADPRSRGPAGASPALVVPTLVVLVVVRALLVVRPLVVALVLVVLLVIPAGGLAATPPGPDPIPPAFVTAAGLVRPAGLEARGVLAAEPNDADEAHHHRDETQEPGGQGDLRDVAEGDAAAAPAGRR